MSYLTKPMVGHASGAELTTLRAILEAARSSRARAVRVAVMGDSISTYNGSGNVATGCLNFEWWKHHRNCPEMPIQDPFSVGGGAGSPPPGDGVWGCVAFAYGGGATTRTSSFCLRGLEGSVSVYTDIVVATEGAVFNVNHDQYQALVPVAQAPRENYEFFTRAGMRAEIFVPRLAGNHDTIQWWNAHTTTSAINAFNFFDPAFGTLAAEGTIDISTAVGAEGPTMSYLTPAYTFASTPSTADIHSNYAQFMFGSEETSGQPVDIMGVIMRSANTRGITYSMFGTGGIMAADYLTGRENSAGSLTAIAPDIIIWRLGVNDQGNGQTAAQYKTSMQALITWSKTVETYGGGDPLIILEAGPDVLAANAPYDDYPDKLYELSQENTGVIFLNMRRRMEERWGWKDGAALMTYSDDGTHPNAVGASIWAKEHIQLLLELASDGGWRDIYLSNQAALVGLQGL